MFHFKLQMDFHLQLFFLDFENFLHISNYVNYQFYYN